MKTIFAIGLLILAVSTTAQQINRLRISESEKNQMERKLNFIQSEGITNYDLVYHRAEWEAYPDQNYIKGTITTYFKAKIDGFAQLVFNLASSLQIDSIKYHLSNTNFTFTDNLITINLPEILDIEVLDSVTIYYQGVPNSNGFGSFATGFSNSSPVLWTLSEPYGAMDWWPCKQSLTDKIDSMDIYVKSGANYKVGSNGKLMSEIITDDTKITHWKTRYPIATYLVAIAISDYSVLCDTAWVDDNHWVEILNYAYPQSLADAQNTSEHTVKTLELFSRLFIPYPFYKEKYGHAQFGWGGGMEHQTMTFLSGFYDILITHEMAHQWFGDYVTCGSWHDIWINEGFATYCEAISIENLYPDKLLSWKEDELSTILSAPGGSVYVDDTTSVNRIFSGRLSYSKGAYVLEMLRNEIGDEAFFAGCKRILNESAKKGGFAKTPDIQHYFETTADTNLTGFFNNWIYGQGYPTYNIIYEIDEDGDMNIQINQTTSDPSVDFFAMHIDILITTDYEDKKVRFHNTSNGQIFTIKQGVGIRGISFDPDMHLAAKVTINPGVVISENEVSGIIFSPNPVNGKMTIDNQSGKTIKHLEIYNNKGQKMYDEHTLNMSKIELNLSNLKNGNYILKAELEDKTITHKFILAK
jgi:aminopeptidase N